MKILALSESTRMQMYPVSGLGTLKEKYLLHTSSTISFIAGFNFFFTLWKQRRRVKLRSLNLRSAIRFKFLLLPVSLASRTIRSDTTYEYNHLARETQKFKSRLRKSVPLPNDPTWGHKILYGGFSTHQYVSLIKIRGILKKKRVITSCSTTTRHNLFYGRLCWK